MDYREKRVRHSTFGNGTIINQDEKYLMVQFDEVEKTKKFIYPDCFDFFLKFEDESINQEIKEEKQKVRKEIEQKQTQENQERKIQNERRKTIVSVNAFCIDYQEAITNELIYLQSHESKKYKIHEGKRLEKGFESVYSFELDDDLNLPPQTNVSLEDKGITYEGTIISCEDFTLLVSTRNDLGDEVPVMELSAQAWMLLSKLKERLEELKERPSRIVKDLIFRGNEQIDYKNKRIVRGQENAIQMALKNPITFIWGPPGTGKTQTLAQIAIEHMKRNHRILMVSYSNVSVDEAVLRLSQLKDWNPGEVIRYGNTRKTEVKEHEYLTVENLIIHDYPELFERRKQLKKKLEYTSRISPDYKDIKRELNQISAKLQEEKNLAISKANFVATTISMAVVNKKIYEGNYDVVIFDEASMAYVPQIIYAASLARKHFICIGDFKQLPPIVQSGSTSKLNEDIFDYCGITSAVNAGYSHKWLCMLDMQYRMHSEIADFVSKNFYKGLLKSAEIISKEREDIINAAPMMNCPISMVDLSQFLAIASKAEDKSHYNVLSAFLSFQLALSAENQDVGIITPYHAQSRLIHAMVRDYKKMNEETKIHCATVHQFQGSEKDLIIYDVVDSYNLKKPGILLESSNNNYANRLFNVAMTRAKGKFIALGNIDYMMDKMLPNTLLFRKFINEIKYGNYPYRDFTNLFTKDIKQETERMTLSKDKDENSFYEDLQSAKKSIQIDLPGQILSEQAVSHNKQFFQLIQQLKKKGIQVSIRVPNKSKIANCYQKYIVENKEVKVPITIIDKKIIWYGKPYSIHPFHRLASVHLQANNLDIRFKGKHTASTLISLLNMSDILDYATTVVKDRNDKAIVNNFSTYVLANVTCSKCNQPMQVKKNKRGVYYLGCTNKKCKAIEYVKEDLVETYLYRNYYCDPKCKICHSSLEPALGKYGVYLRCCQNRRHCFNLDILLK